MMIQNSQCLINEFSRLKRSSSEAVENLDSFSEFKEYMHIERRFEKDLKNLLLNMQESSKPNLVLVCGSVGDGKSHLLSYMKSHYPDLFKNTLLHNDATESSSPTKTSIETLNEVLMGFSDMNLTNENYISNLVIAINLGTLSNFLTSKYGVAFGELKKFVDDKKIIEDEIVDMDYSEDIPFSFINLSDYQLFELTDDGIESSFQYNFFRKITDSRDSNPFYKVYTESCQSCPVKDKCPVVRNYELLANKQVQSKIIKNLAELVIKYKVIISPRTYFDFIYHILVDESLGQKNSFEDIKQILQNLDDVAYIESLLPNLFYNYSAKTEMFQDLKNLQPGSNRSNEIDDLVITFFNTEDISGIFKNYISEKIYERLRLAEIIDSERYKSQSYRSVLFHTLLRINSFTQNDELLIENKEEYFDKYIRLLYFWNKNDIKGLRQLYNDTILTIHNLNGKNEQGKINLLIGRNQRKFQISQEIIIKPLVEKTTTINNEILDRFLTQLTIRLKVEGLEKTYLISIDYNLFRLIQQTKMGYRPNNYDKSNFVSFVDTAEKMIKDNSNNDNVTFSQEIGKKTFHYILTLDEFGCYEFKENENE